MKEIIERLQRLADRAKKYKWNDESEVVVRLSDVRAVLGFYERHKSKSEPPSATDITPEWDKIPEGFDWVAVDEDGEEYAFTSEPFYLSACWIKGANVFTGRKLNMKGIDWTKTLSKRPAK